MSASSLANLSCTKVPLGFPALPWSNGSKYRQGMMVLWEEAATPCPGFWVQKCFPGWERKVIYESVLEHGRGGTRDLLMETRYLSAEDFQNSHCWLSSNILLWVTGLHKFIQDLPQFRRKWIFDVQKMCTGYLGCCCAYISFSLLPLHRNKRMAHICLIPFNIPALSCVGLGSRQNQFGNCSDRHMSTNRCMNSWRLFT